MDVVGGSTDLVENAALAPDDATHVVVEAGFQRGGDVGFPVLGAEHEMELDVGEGSGHDVDSKSSAPLGRGML